jgi:hypothetical protein
MDEMLGKHGKLACVDPHSCKELATGVIQLWSFILQESKLDVWYELRTCYCILECQNYLQELKSQKKCWEHFLLLTEIHIKWHNVYLPIVDCEENKVMQNIPLCRLFSLKIAFLIFENLVSLTCMYNLNSVS